MNPNKTLLTALGGVTALLAAQSYRQYRRALPASAHWLRAHSQHAQTRLGSITYGQAGNGPPALIIHGAGGGFEQGLHHARRFGAGFTWVAPARFGYLGTPLPANPSPAAQAEAHAALLDALGIERLPVVAISAGGPSAIYFALRYPQRCSHLVLISAVSQALLPVSANPALLHRLYQWGLRREYLIWLGVQLTRRGVLPPPGVPAKLAWRNSPTGRNWLQGLLEHALPVALRRDGLANDAWQLIHLALLPLEAVRVPTLVIHAADDTLVPVDHALNSTRIPGARLVILPQGGHLLFEQQPSLEAEIGVFLAGG